MLSLMLTISVTTKFYFIAITLADQMKEKTLDEADLANSKIFYKAILFYFTYILCHQILIQPSVVPLPMSEYLLEEKITQLEKAIFDKVVCCFSS